MSVNDKDPGIPVRITKTVLNLFQALALFWGGLFIAYYFLLVSFYAYEGILRILLVFTTLVTLVMLWLPKKNAPLWWKKDDLVRRGCVVAFSIAASAVFSLREGRSFGDQVGVNTGPLLLWLLWLKWW